MDESLLREIETCQRCDCVSAAPYIPGYPHRRRNAEEAYRWKPADVKLLLVGESPPRRGEYFYLNPTPVFTAVADALCPDLDPLLEHGMLVQKLADSGVFLVDLAKCAVNYQGDVLDKDERDACLLECTEHFLRELDTLRPRTILPVLKRIRWILCSALQGTEWYGGALWQPELPFPNYPDRRQEFVRGLKRVASSLGITVE